MRVQKGWLICKGLVCGGVRMLKCVCVCKHALERYAEWPFTK